MNKVAFGVILFFILVFIGAISETIVTLMRRERAQPKREVR